METPFLYYFDDGPKSSKLIPKLTNIEEKFTEISSYNLNRSREASNLKLKEPVIIKQPSPVNSFTQTELELAFKPIVSQQQPQPQNDIPFKKIKKFLILFGIILTVVFVICVVALILIIVFGTKQTEATTLTNISTTTTTTRVTTSTTQTSSTTTTTRQKCTHGYTGYSCSDFCGQGNSKPNLRIFGGIEAEPYSWPSTVLIRFKYTFFYTPDNDTYNDTYTSYCGGSLISRRIILTAAHCLPKQINYVFNDTSYTQTVAINSLHSTFESMFTVYFGLHNSSEIFNLTLPAYSRPIQSFIQHSSYDSSTMLNDIAVIRLSSFVTLNNYIQLACLPQNTRVPYPTQSGINAWAIGWGDASNSNSITPILNNVKLKIYENSQCDLINNGYPKELNKQICAGETNKDTCQSDSGGPLFINDYVSGLLSYVLVGVTSYGNDCANTPTVYTRVSYYVSWLENYIYL